VISWLLDTSILCTASRLYSAENLHRYVMTQFWLSMSLNQVSGKAGQNPHTWRAGSHERGEPKIIKWVYRD
jgi:hypothetical protein